MSSIVYPPSLTKSGCWFVNFASINAFFDAGKGVPIFYPRQTFHSHAIIHTGRARYKIVFVINGRSAWESAINFRYSRGNGRRGFLLAFRYWRLFELLIDQIRWKITKQHLVTCLLGRTSPDTPIFRFFRHPLCHESQLLRIIASFLHW